MTVGPVDPVAIALPSRYRFVRTLGSGGMATVHLAVDEVTGREVAVKVLRRDLAGAVTIERFLLEVRVTQELRHPHVIPLLDAGEVDGIPFLAMPYVAGETLQQRLRRERQLPLAEAVRIVRAVGGALTLAHAHGFLHRDVKPANVLLDGEGVFLTDFGIARAIQRSATDQLTVSGISIGTAGYMSPEQATGDPTLDGRADQYALACVAYEMLAGEPPFTGPTGREVIAKQLSLAAPSVRVIRPALPEAVDAVLRRALEKVPADRFPTVQAFDEALEEAARQPAGSSVPSGTAHPAHGPGAVRAATTASVAAAAPSPRARPLVMAMVTLTLALAGTLTARELGVLGDGLPRLVPADSVRYAVMPIRAGGAALPGVATDAVRSALAQWTDLEVADEARVREALADEGAATPAEPSEEARAARRLRAGRYVRGEIVAGPAGPVMRLRLIDAVSRDAVVGEVESVLTAGGGDGGLAAGVAVLVERLLVGEAPPDGGATRVLAARRAQAAGAEALRRFALPAAERAFEAAVAADGRYATAHLGLALARMWGGDEPARWRINAEQALLGADALDARHGAIARALAATARDDLGTACDAWRALARRDPRDVLAHLGLAHCVVEDDIVERDPRSPSGWAFRTSYREGLAAYEQAFRLEPAILEAFGGAGMDRLRRLFRVAGNQLRRGRRAPGEPTAFSANMTWSGDSLAFVPYPKAPATPHVTRDPAARNEAIRRQRALLRDITAMWVAAAGGAAEARQAHGMALAGLGDPRALDELARARALAADGRDALRVAHADLALRLAFGIRERDTLAVRAVRSEADSLLRSAADADRADRLLLSALAALTGRVELAAALARTSTFTDQLALPGELADGVAELLTLAALGAPAERLRAPEDRVAMRIDRMVPAAERAGRRAELLARAASLAFPHARSARLDSLVDADPLVAVQSALGRSDLERARDGLETFRRARAGLLPESITLDALAPEAELWLAMGEPGLAAAWLDPVLSELPLLQPHVLSSPILAASLVRALEVRAEAAAQRRDEGAARFFTQAVEILRGGGTRPSP